MRGGKGASGQNNSSPGFARFAGQRPRAQRSISGDLIFGYFVSRQSNSPPAAIERANVVASTKYFVSTKHEITPSVTEIADIVFC